MRVVCFFELPDERDDGNRNYVKGVF